MIIYRLQFRLKNRNFAAVDLIQHFLYKKLFGDTLIYGIGAVLPRLINYGFLKLFTSILDKEGFSFYADMYAISFLLISILTFGFESAYFRFLYKQKNTDRNKVFSSGMLSLVFIALIFLTIGMFFVKEISYFAGYGAHREYFSMFFLIIFFDAISSLPMAWLRIHNKALRYALIRIINVCLQAFITFWLLSGNSEPPANFFSFLNGIKGYTDKTGYIFYANMLASIVSFLCLFDIIIEIRFKKFQMKLALEMLAYGTPIMLGTLAFAINENLDKILIKRWLSDEVNGAYAACYRIAAFMALYATAFRLGIEPFYFKKAKDANAKETYSQLTYLFTLFGTVFFVLLWSNLNWISHFMIGANYQSARNIIPVIMMANLFLGIYTNLSIAYKVKDRPVIGTYISLIGALVTILSNFLLLIPQLGYMASAWGTLASYGSMMLISYWWGQKNYRINYPVARLGSHLILGILVGYCLGEKFPYYNVIGQFLYLYVVFFMEKSTLIKYYMDRLKIKIRNISSNTLPQYETEGAAGMDLQAHLESPILLEPMERKAIPTGIYIELPKGYEAQIRPRSGLALKKGISCANAPGTIDSDYRGEIKVLLINLSKKIFEIQPGDRIAQMVIKEYTQIEWQEAKELQESNRGEKGFGSTGV